MKTFVLLLTLSLFFCSPAWSQSDATIREYQKSFTTYPFSDPDPIAKPDRIYPYYRYDGFSSQSIQKDWKVVELENDYIKVMILPEIGGKIWAAIEKSTGEPFIYYNHVVKFRDVAMRGPWTSGGIEANYGIIGHTPNCATPVDYKMVNKKDGSVSCIIGVLDLLTRSTWRIEINLPKDKAYFTTSSFWYNASTAEQPYYTWMNTGIKAAGNLEFIYPGTSYLGHGGDVHEWPINKEGKNISFYENNNFGGPKSYHVFGKYTNFYGGYWHDDDFGMGRYSPHDEKPGKKIWIWGLSQQGMIWEKLLTDNDGQYVEVQSGRLFNQAAANSTFTPFKHKGFLPHQSDTWTEYWFPVVKTKGFVVANNFGALNVKPENGWLKIYLSPLQSINDELKIVSGNKTIFSKTLHLKPLELFVDSIRISNPEETVHVTLGENKLVYNSSPSAEVLARPTKTPENFDWNSVYGLYLQGKERMRQKDYSGAQKNLEACLAKDPNYLPSLTNLSNILYRSMHYDEALENAKRALSIDTYNPAANYYYGLINKQLGNIVDAKDGFDIASQGMEYRSAAFNELSKLYLAESNIQKSIYYARKSINYNHFAVDAWQQLAVCYRLLSNKNEAEIALDSLSSFDPLNHFVSFEKYLWNPTEQNKENFTGMIRGDLPEETYLELGIWYYNVGRSDDAESVLKLSPPNTKVAYWLAFLENKMPDKTQLNPDFAFPFRIETAKVLEKQIAEDNFWLYKYQLALLQWHLNNTDKAKELFLHCGNEPSYAPFYSSRADLFKDDENFDVLHDLQTAVSLDPNQWRFGRDLARFYITKNEVQKADSVAAKYYNKFKNNYYLGLLYAQTLLLNKKYNDADDLLKQIVVLPNEGASRGRQLYKETKLMLAVRAMDKNRCKKALNYISDSRIWPENLGVGKPYQDNIDERLEDWMAFLCYKKSGNKTKAQQMLDKITGYTKYVNEEGEISNSVNNLVTAWAMKESGEAGKANDFLNRWNENAPDNPVAKWVLATFNGNNAKPLQSNANDINYLVLKELIKIQ